MNIRYIYNYISLAHMFFCRMRNVFTSGWRFLERENNNSGWGSNFIMRSITKGVFFASVPLLSGGLFFC